jgi:hypothetical protein
MDNPQTLAALALLATPLNIVITLVFAILGIVGLHYLHRAVSSVEKLTGVKLTSQQSDDLDAVFFKSIAFAEEQAHKAADKLTGADKLKIAEDAARKLAPTAMKEIDSTQAQILIEAARQSLRPDGILAASPSIAPAAADATAGTRYASPTPARPSIPPPVVTTVPKLGPLPSFDEQPTQPETPSAKR